MISLGSPPSRAPRVLIVDNTAATRSIRDALQTTSMMLRCADTHAAALQALRRFKHDAVIADLPTATALRDAAVSHARPVPPFLIAPEILQHETGAFPSSHSRHRLVKQPLDVRRMVGDIHALMLGLDRADTEPQPVDGRLSLIPDCGLVFSGTTLVPLLRAERAVLIMMAASPGRVFTWEDLKTATGCTQAALYGKVDRLRQTLILFSSGHDYIATIRGRGIALEVDEMFSP
ncbi:MAG: hypothetical protein AB7J30_00310 [Hyphomicrobium sp.]|uniref:hypothetical protein n=1 Tax=Hyphomicrobium sp. TaxID=82 RepID=UPI003D0E4B5D